MNTSSFCKVGWQNLVIFKLKLAYIHPFTLPVCDKDENQEIESIEASLREGNALSHNQQMENIQKDEGGRSASV